MGVSDNSSIPDAMIQRFLTYWLVGNLAGAVAYGVALILSINCILVLARSHATSAQMRRIMMTFVVCMWLISSVAFILVSGGVLRWASNPDPASITLTKPPAWGQPFSPVELILIVLATWGSDGFMIWRCVMLYHGVSTLHRTVVLILVTTLSLASLGSGFCATVTLAPFVGKKWQQYSILSLFELVSLVVNGSISLLIVFRILYHQRFLRRIFGPDYGPGYTKLISIMVESATLTLLLSFLHIVLVATYGRVSVTNSPANMVVIKLITQINAISPILIIFRVAQGRTWQNDHTRTITKLSGDHELGHLQTLKFATNLSLSIPLATCSLDEDPPDDNVSRNEDRNV